MNRDGPRTDPRGEMAKKREKHEPDPRDFREQTAAREQTTILACGCKTTLKRGKVSLAFCVKHQHADRAYELLERFVAHIYRGPDHVPDTPELVAFYQTVIDAVQLLEELRGRPCGKFDLGMPLVSGDIYDSDRDPKTGETYGDLT